MGRRRRRRSRIKKFCIIALILLVGFYVYPRNGTNSSDSENSAISTALLGGTDKKSDVTATGIQEDEDELMANDTMDDHGRSTKVNVVQSSQTFQPCDSNRICKSGQMFFAIRALEMVASNETQFCIGKKRIMPTEDSLTLLKMVSVVVVHEVSLEVESVTHFDVSVDDKVIRDHLLRMPYYRLVFMASSGDVTKKIVPETMSLLSRHFHGSNATFSTSDSDFGSFIFIGQKGLQGEHGEIMTSNYSDVDNLQLDGCLQVPLGTLDTATPLPLPAAVTRLGWSRRPSFIDFRSLPNCTSMKVCDRDNISVIIRSGANKDDPPRICVNGRTIITRNVNEGGRGLNIVVFGPHARKITDVGRFDTYEGDSSQLEDFLDLLQDGELVIVVSNDEASRFLSPVAKFAFSELGSSLVWDLKFRSSWYLIGQKGIGGYSPYEEMNYAIGSRWAKAIDKKFCVPFILDSKSPHLDSPRRRNFAKRRFCDKFDGYEDFCDRDRLDDILSPAMLHNRSLADNPIFKVPILVVGGLSQNSLRLCLETLIAQPGINPDLVLVCYDENYPEGGDLAELFHFRRKPILAAASYSVQLARALSFVWSEYPNATMAMVVEEELLLATDFLSYMAQMLPVLESDDNVVAISAWNINGFVSAANSLDTAYRVEDFPGLAFMIRKSSYSAHMKGKMDQCCLQRVWEGWLLNYSTPSSSNRYQIVIPDVSRVSRRHVDGFGELDRSAEDYFHRERSRSSGRGSWISNVGSLMSEHAYNTSLINLIASSVQLNTSQVLKMCTNRLTLWDRLASITKPTVGQSLAVYFDKPDTESLVQLRRCFGLFYHSARYKVRNGQKGNAAWTRRGFYKGILRFSAPDGRFVFLIASDSPFYRLQTDSNGTIV